MIIGENLGGLKLSKFNDQEDQKYPIYYSIHLEFDEFIRFKIIFTFPHLYPPCPEVTEAMQTRRSKSFILGLWAALQPHVVTLVQ